MRLRIYLSGFLLLSTLAGSAMAEPAPNPEPGADVYAARRANGTAT